MKNFIVINRFHLRPNSLDKMKGFLADWQQFLKKHAPMCDMEIIALNEEYACWLEHWESRAELDVFQGNHVCMSDYPSRSVELSYPNSEREVFKRVK